MEKVKVDLEVAKEVYEFTKGLSQFVAIVKKEIDDNGGWSMGDDLPGVITAALGTLLPAFDGLQKVKDEIAEDKVAFAKGLIVGLSDLAEVLTKKA